MAVSFFKPSTWARRAGFTLVELAIILVIVGAIAGAVVAGREVMHNAQLKTVFDNTSQYAQAARDFKKIYGALPGDLWDGQKRFGGADTIVKGNGNGVLEADSGECDKLGNPAGCSDNELRGFWQHLALAGLIPGSYDPASDEPGVGVPQGQIASTGYYVDPSFAALSDQIVVSMSRYDRTAAARGYAALKPEDAWSIDKKYDDGKANDGFVRAAEGTGHAAADCFSGADYALSNKSETCILGTQIEQVNATVAVNVADASVCTDEAGTSYNVTQTKPCSCPTGMTGTCIEVCSPRGKWELDPLSDCAMPPNCASLPTASNAVEVGCVVPASDTDTCTMNCDSGYETGGGAASYIVTCNVNVWSHAETCGTSCPAPVVANASATMDSFGAGVWNATVTCDSGYTISPGVNTAAVTCDPALDTWAPATTCSAGCLASALSGYDSARMNPAGTNLTDSGDSETFTCKAGYTGADTNPSCTNGAWTGAAPACLQQCDTAAIGFDTNTTEASVSGTVASGGTTVISCKAGYSGDPAATFTCTDGAWGGTLPNCAQQCLVSAITGYNGGTMDPVGTTATDSGNSEAISCKAGYTGATTNPSCSSGAWTGSAPTCTAAGCGADPVADLSWDSNVYAADAGTSAVGDTRSARCKSANWWWGMPTTTTCQADSTWTNTPPTCVSVDCTVAANCNSTGTPAECTGSPAACAALTACSAPASSMKPSGSGQASGGTSLTYGSYREYQCDTCFGATTSGTVVRQLVCDNSSAWKGTNAGSCTIAGTPDEMDLGTLDGNNGVKFLGEQDFDNAGFDVKLVRDVNGDGKADMLIGSYDWDGSSGGASAEKAYLVFGQSTWGAGTFALSSLDGTTGVEFTDSSEPDPNRLGFNVADAGDVNADGYSDFLIGNWAGQGTGSFTNGRGNVYLVFGKAAWGAGTFDLATLDGSNGVKFMGPVDGDAVGYSVDSAGDVNGDGITDIIMGGNTSASGGTERGGTWLVFGRKYWPKHFDLSGLNGKNGVKFMGELDNDWAGFSVAGVGDVTGDGKDDVLIGAPYADDGGTDRGVVYLVHGQSSWSAGTYALSALDNDTLGVKFRGQLSDYGQIGIKLGKTGDLNNDGKQDIILGTYNAAGGGTRRGEAFLIYGKATWGGSAFDVETVNGTTGVKFVGAADEDTTGMGVDGAGDINDDGIPDLLISGTQEGDADLGNGLPHRGRAYLVWGRATWTPGTPSTFDLGTIDGITNGVALQAGNDFDHMGWEISGGQDVNGDGYNDILTGANFAELGGTKRGAAYLIYGRENWYSTEPQARNGSYNYGKSGATWTGTLSCNSGFTGVGSATCTSGATTWGAAATCAPNACVQASPPMYFTWGAAAWNGKKWEKRLMCDDGFGFSGSNPATCTAGGATWSYASSCLDADWATSSTVMADSLINTSISNNQYRAQAVQMANGNVFTVWSSLHTTSGDIYAKIYDHAGGLQLAQFRVNTTTGNLQQNASVASLSNGNVVVVWESNMGAGNYDIRAIVYDQYGTVVVSEYTVNTTTAGNQTVPVVAALENGDFAVAWQSAGQDGSGLGVYYRIFNETGGTITNVTTEQLTPENTANDQDSPAIVKIDTVRFMIAWNSMCACLGEADKGVMGRIFYNDGTGAETSEFRINQNTAGDQYLGTLNNARSMISDGASVWVVFVDGGGLDGDGAGVILNEIDAGGAQVSGDIVVNATTSGDQLEPAIALSPNPTAGRVYMVTYHGANMGGGAANDVAFQMFVIDGSNTKMGSETMVNTVTAGDQVEATPTILHNGSFLILYQDQNTRDTNGYGVYGRILKPGNF